MKYDSNPAPIDYKILRFDKALKKHHRRYFRKNLFEQTYKPMFSIAEVHEHGTGLSYKITDQSISRQELSILNTFCVDHNIDFAVLPGAAKIVWFIDNYK